MTTSVTSPHREHATTSTRPRQLAHVARAAGLGFVAALLVAGFLDPGYSHLSEGVSALASVESRAAGVMIVGFLLLATTALASGAALWSTLQGKAGRTAAALVIAAGLLTVLDGFARQSCSTLQQACLAREEAGDVSSAHVLHNLSALVLFTFLVVAGFLFAAALRRSDGWRTLARPTRLVAFLTLVLMLWFGSAAFGQLGGLVQRALIVLAYGLPVVLALRLTRSTDEDGV